jgi:hypothetical protein
MNIDDFASDFLGSSKSKMSSLEPPKLKGFADITGRFSNAEPIVVTSIWQTLLESPDLSKKLYPDAVKKISGTPSLKMNLEKYLLCLGDGKYCLLIFDPSFTSNEPIYMDASENNSERSMKTGIGMWQSKMNASIVSKNRFGIGDGFEANSSPYSMAASIGDNLYSQEVVNVFKPKAIYESMVNSEWPVIIAKPPKRIYNCLRPEKPHRVSVDLNENFNSLAGIYTRNANGEFGVTVCLHSFPDSYAELGKTKVRINELTGTVVSMHRVSDSCFVKLDVSEAMVKDLINSSGPLSGTTPRDYEKCSFVNKYGAKIDTTVIGWSPDIMYYDPYNQVKVLTKADTNPGDSGGALIDSDGNVLGFSFYRTELNATKEFSAWIWAASVFKAHNLIF